MFLKIQGCSRNCPRRLRCLLLPVEIYTSTHLHIYKSTNLQILLFGGLPNTPRRWKQFLLTKLYTMVLFIKPKWQNSGTRAPGCASVTIENPPGKDFLRAKVVIAVCLKRLRHASTRPDQSIDRVYNLHFYSPSERTFRLLDLPNKPISLLLRVVQKFRKSRHITSVPALRDAPRNETNYRYFEFN